jgi:Domain of unknown function (DUF6702)
LEGKNQVISKLHVLAVALCLSCAGWVFAHPYHNSVAQITWKDTAAPNSQSNDFASTRNTNSTLSGTLQVALKVIPEDLEAVLGIHHQRTVVLDDHPKTDKIIFDYLWQRFRVRNEAGKQLPMQWLGKQVNHNNTWLYFEILVSPSARLNLENRILMDLKSSQINRTSVEINGVKNTYTHTVKNTDKIIWPINDTVM